jgi:RNA polymerase sigma factor (sigma-70 family)
MISDYAKRAQVEEWLRDYKSLKDTVESLKEQIHLVGEDGMGVDTSRESVGKTNKFSSTVETAMIQSRKLQEELETYESLLDKLNNALDTLDATERLVLIRRLIEGKYYHEFVKEVGKQERTCRDIKKQAVDKMVKELEELFK